MRYFRVVIILFSTGFSKSVFSSYFFGKLGFLLSVFWTFIFLYLCFFAFIFLFCVLNSMSSLIMSELITLFNFLLTLLGPLFINLDDFSQSYERLFPDNFTKVIKYILYVANVDMFFFYLGWGEAEDRGEWWRSSE